MNKYTGTEVKNKLLEGAIIYLDDTKTHEKRLYRYNNLSRQVEYSDNYIDWKSSKIMLDDFMSNTWVIFKRQ